MPYILPRNRDVLDPAIETLLNALREVECDDPTSDVGGNLNYIITRLLHRCYGTRYAEMAKAVSVLEMAKLEFYRVVCAPYEAQKSHDNGSVD